MTNCTQYWDYDDFTRCARVEYFETKVPGLVLAASFVIITSQFIYKYIKYSKSLNDEYQPLLTNDPGSVSYTTDNTTTGASGDHNGNNNSIQTSFTEKIKISHFDISSLPPVKLDGKPHGETVKVKRSIVEKFRVYLEELLILTQLFLQFTKCFNKNYDYSGLTLFINIGLWAWLLILTTVRLMNLNDDKKVLFKVLPNLWINNFVVYLFLLPTLLLSFRSALIGHTKTPSYHIFEFIITSCLFTNLLFSEIGFRNPDLYITSKEIKPSPESITSLASFTTFSWVDPLLWTAYLSSLKIKDVWDLKLDDYSYYVIKNFKVYSTKNKQWTFSKRLITFFSRFLLLQAFWALMESIILFAPTLLLKKILEYVDNRASTSSNLAWFYVFLMFASKMFSNICSGQALFFGRRVCIRLKSIIISEIYAKALRKKLSASEVKGSDDDENEPDEQDPQAENPKDADEEGIKTSRNIGGIINLMAVDAFKVSEVCAYLHAFVGATCMIIVAIVLLYKLLGWSAIVGAISIIALSPVSFYFAKMLGVYQKKMLEVSDRRTQKLNETFQSIRIIKFFAWEDNFKENIYKIRHEELDYLKKRTLVWAASSFIWFITPTVVTFASFGCYIFISKQKLTTPIAFTALSLFNLLRNPLDQISEMLSFVIQSKVSLNRIQDFLNEEESTKYEQLTSSIVPNKIGFKDANFSWNSSSEVDFRLRNLNIDFKIGKLNVIVGPTGSGKTSLLMALLGEMEKISGEIYLPGFQPKEELKVDKDGLTESVAYCSQAAWLLNDTIKNNIVFAAPFNKDRYNKVVKACGLARDFEILKAGDQTEIGEKGIALSGGQKQRVSLARALYSNSKHILLDDCLSAVDSHTALWIYEHCIAGPLMENRTVILVSHNVPLVIKSAEYIVMMENGKVVNQGSPEYLLNAGALGDDEMIKSSVLASRSNSSMSLSQQNNHSTIEQVASKLKKVLTSESEVEDQPEETEQELEEIENMKKGKLIAEESKQDGVVSIEVYKWYTKVFGGAPIFLIIAVIFVLGQFSNIYQSWWVRAWAKSFENDFSSQIFTKISFPKLDFYGMNIIDFSYRFSNSLLLRYNYAQEKVAIAKASENSSVFYITIYTLLGVGYAAVASIRMVVVYYAGIRASSRVFKVVLSRVLRAKLRFFDSTPIGRIMNRFSKDIEGIDQELVPFADGAISCLVSVIFTLVLIAYITPAFIFLAVLILALYYTVAFFYLNASRELKRFDSITKSPIHQHFSETLVGISTIRAYGVERRFLQENINKIDDNNRPFFYMWVTNRWLSCRNDFIGSLVIFFSGAFVLYYINEIDAGLAGISLSYAIAFNESALWVVRLYANVEMSMNSVERLKEYLEVEQEPEEYLPDNEPPVNWPNEGKLEVSNLSLRYAPHLPMVIKNVTFNVEPMNKIGIVGRTGAGKSTIITALFRFLDPETGFIKIDGVDITSIGLKNLRQAITIIPQDPTLFTGTIKSNLDPFDLYTPNQIFEALRRVNLLTNQELKSLNVNQNPLVGSGNANDDSDENVNKFLNLDNEITEGGNNLSQGQRQLMCLARSLLRSPKIMLLDEATASIDYESDARIQATIRQEFSQSTILTIAHRLRSIIDYDKILVMDAGQVIEFDHPYKLIIDKSTTFYSMCEDSGELEALTALAKEAFMHKTNSKLNHIK